MQIFYYMTSILDINIERVNTFYVPIVNMRAVWDIYLFRTFSEYSVVQDIVKLMLFLTLFIFLLINYS